MQTTLVLLLVGATYTWSGRVEAPQSKVTIYPARALAADALPCVADASKKLIDSDCTDEKSVLALIASAKKEAALTPLATVTADKDGRFQVTVPEGRLYVHVDGERSSSELVVEPVRGVETRLPDDGDTKADGRGRVSRIIDERGEDDDFKEVWVIGQDTPHLTRLDAADVDALFEGTLKKPLSLGCSKVVSARGRHLGATCDERGRPLRSSRALFKGTVVRDGKPQAGVRVTSSLGDDTTFTNTRGEYELELPEYSMAAVIAEKDGFVAAASLTNQPQRLVLGAAPLPSLRVLDSKGVPAVGARVRFWQRGIVVDTVTDANGVARAPKSLVISRVSVVFSRHRDFQQRVDLDTTREVTLTAARVLTVTFRHEDGVLLQHPNVSCNGCLEVEQPPSRTGVVRLLEPRGDALVLVSGHGEVTVTRDGPVVVRDRVADDAARQNPFMPGYSGDGEWWSTEDGRAAPGRQAVMKCESGVCVLRTVEVRAGDKPTVAAPTLTTLDVKTVGHQPGKPMPYGIDVESPALLQSVHASFERDGVAHVTDLPPGPWFVTAGRDSDVAGVWCRAGVPCELDLRRRQPATTIRLKGAVPREVHVFREDASGRDYEVGKGGVIDLHWSDATPRIIEETTIVSFDGGVPTVTLAAPATIKVRVTDEKRQPVVDAAVSWGSPQYGSWLTHHVVLTDERGLAEFSGVRPGNLPLRVAKVGFALTMTPGTARENQVTLKAAHTLTCRLRGVSANSNAWCRVVIGGALSETVEMERVGDDFVTTLTEVPGAPVEVVVGIEALGLARTQTVDPTKTTEVVFDAPRTGARLVLPFTSAVVKVPGFGDAGCRRIGESPFCETAPLPPGPVTVNVVGSLSYSFAVDVVGEGRVFIPFPENMK